jgi:hypothetical protein
MGECRRGLGQGVGWAAILTALLSTAGCFGHVRLTAPPSTAPLKARTKAYKALRPEVLSYEEITDNSGTYGPFAQHLSLAGGQSIVYPDDLLPVVAPKSECAGAVHAYLGAVRIQRTLYLAGLPLFLAGVVLTSAGVLSAMNGVATGTGDGSLPPSVGVGGVLVGAGVILTGVGSFVFGPITRDDTRRAFESYDAGLQARLGVQVKVRTVEAPASATPGSP